MLLFLSPAGGGHFSLHVASRVGLCGFPHTMVASGPPDTGVAAWGCKVSPQKTKPNTV